LSIDSALALAKRLKRERQARDLPPVILIVGCPEPARLGLRPRERAHGVDRGEVFEADISETTASFHARLCAIARERAVYVVSVGSDQPVLESRYNRDGSPVTVN
jgi:hypothetical protein